MGSARGNKRRGSRAVLSATGGLPSGKLHSGTLSRGCWQIRRCQRPCNLGCKIYRKHGDGHAVILQSSRKIPRPRRGISPGERQILSEYGACWRNRPERKGKRAGQVKRTRACELVGL